MYNQPYFIPRYFTSTAHPMMRGAMNGTMGRAMGNALNGAGFATHGVGRGLGLFGRLGNSMRAIRSINWGGLITNASKTLNVVNQAIPLVRQVGPMVNNMKSMLRIASIFKDETDKKPVSKVKNTNNHNNNYKKNSNQSDTREQTDYDNSPTFFVEA